MESKDVEVTEKDVIEIMQVFNRASPMMLKMVIKMNINVVKSFGSQIKDYYANLNDEELVKVEKVMEMPVPELQNILKKAYMETGQKQLKILANPKSRDFIEGNMKELKILLFP